MEKIVGIDIGESSVKLAYFAGGEMKKAVTAELPDNMVSGAKILSMDAMADFLRRTARENAIPLTNAALVLPSTEVFTRDLVMPAMTEQQLRYNLPYEFRDYPTEMSLFACAALKETVERYRAMLHRAGFKLQVLTPSECAYSGLLRAYYRRTGAQEKDMCVVNLGHSATFLYIYRGEQFDSRREIDLGIGQLERLVADHCGVDVHVARGYVQSDFGGVLTADYARELYGRIAVEIMKAVNFFNYNNRERELTELCLCGGGSAIEPLRQAIETTTGMHLLPAGDLLGKSDTDVPWMYLRAAGGVDEGIRGGLK